jgi:hypothetical protein
MHLEVQSTSPASQASMQAIMEACAGSAEAVLALVAVVPVLVDWALARTARAPARRTEVKRILGGCIR